MNLRLVREPSLRGATLGVLLLDGVFQGFTLEDEIREVSGQPVASWKVAGRTAIPAGRYQVALTYSTRFQRVMPQLLDVPGFSGIRLHPGNAIEDTEGCILVGRTRSTRWVGQSRAAFAELYDRLVHATEDRWITIENPAASVSEAA